MNESKYKFFMKNILITLLLSTGFAVSCDIAQDVIDQMKEGALSQNITPERAYADQIQNSRPRKGPGEIIAGYMYLLKYRADGGDTLAKAQYDTMILQGHHTSDTYPLWDENVFSKYPTCKHYTTPDSLGLMKVMMESSFATQQYAQKQENTWAAQDAWEQHLQTTTVRDDLNSAALQVSAGALGVSQENATKDEYLRICRFLYFQITHLQNHNQSFDDMMQHYSLDGLDPNSREYQHRRALRIVASALYTASRKLEKSITSADLDEIQKRVGANVKIDDIVAQLDYAYTQKAFKGFQIKMEDLSANKDDLLTEQSVRAYQHYTNNRDVFYHDFQADLNKTLPNNSENAGKRKLIQNVVGFVMATQQEIAQQNIVSKLNDEGEWELNLYRLETAIDQCKGSGAGQFEFDSSAYARGMTHQLDMATMKKPSIDIVKNARNIFRNLFGTMVRGYVYAKQENRLKEYFEMAFPKTDHDTASLTEKTEKWLLNQTVLKQTKEDPYPEQG